MASQISSGSEMSSRPPSVVDRYFKKRYKTDILNKTGEDQLVLTHSNRICVVCIAKSHAIFASGKCVSSVNFQGEGWNRLDNTVSGKSKRGAQWLERSAPLCTVTCSDGSVYTLICCVKGQLVEINSNLLANPILLTSKPSCEGYIAIILPGLKGFDHEVQRLKSEEAYSAVLAARQERHSVSHKDDAELLRSETGRSCLEPLEDVSGKIEVEFLGSVSNNGDAAPVQSVSNNADAAPVESVSHNGDLNV